MDRQNVTTHYEDEDVTLYRGDSLEALRGMRDGSVNCCVTSPPYFGLRDYGIDGQYGLEATPAEYVETMRELFAEVRRVLADDGTFWLNIGDSYSTRVAVRTSSHQDGLNGDEYVKDWARDKARGLTRMPTFLPEKNLFGVPWRVAFALQDDGWILRNDIIWHKGNGMPSSVTDRLSNKYEHVFLFSKSKRYHFDLDAIREPLLHPDAADGTRTFGGRNKGTEGGIGSTERNRGHNTYTATPSNGKNPGDVWKINTQPFRGAHFAVMPQKLAERCILAGSRPGDVILDPFSGSATVGKVALDNGRRYVGIDLSAEYHDIALATRLAGRSIPPWQREAA